MNGQSLVRADFPLPGGAEAVYDGSGFAYYRHADLFGSLRLATTYSSGLYSSTALAPYGEPLDEAGTKDRSFTGQKQDIANGSARNTDANGQYDFLAREYSPSQSRWWTPDPAGLAAVDPDDPQTWDRYSYASAGPLVIVDPSGRQPCDAASIGNSRQDGSEVGGPYRGDDAEPDSSGDDCSGSLRTCYLDFTDVGCDLLGELTGGPAGPGALPESVQSAVPCAWADCMGIGGALDPNGNPWRCLYQAPGCGCKAGSWGVTANCQVGVGSAHFPQISPSVLHCGLSENTPCAIAVIANANFQPVWVAGGGPPAVGDKIMSSITYSRSYGAFLYCEGENVLSSMDMIAAVNSAPILSIEVAPPRAPLLFATALIWDVGGAFEIREKCAMQTNGPGSY